MQLRYVTLTGADNQTDPQKMGDLSQEFPFVEWAILFSQSKSGQSRYPTSGWVESLLNVAEKQPMNLSAHLCGKWVDDALQGEITFLRDSRLKNAFNRIQLNMGKDRLKIALQSDLLLETCQQSGKQVIFGGNYKHQIFQADTFLKYDIYPLFDASGGRGVNSQEWPQPLGTEECILFCGYAGGLGPQNITAELENIKNVVDEAIIWIDMETHIRTKDEFDLEKCRTVLELCRPYAG